MATLSEPRIAELLEAYWSPATPGADVASMTEVLDKERVVAQVSAYLDLLLRWNARTNLTAIREPEEIVRRHFGECFFAAKALSQRLPTAATVLDFGSGAGFPGIPFQLYHSRWQVTLAESQGKKAAFLREAVRTLELPTEVWANRVEAMPEGRRFDCVALRAVDKMAEALKSAAARVSQPGIFTVLAGGEIESLPPVLADWRHQAISIPQSQQNRLLLYTRPDSSG